MSSKVETTVYPNGEGRVGPNKKHVLAEDLYMGISADHTEVVLTMTIGQLAVNALVEPALARRFAKQLEHLAALVEVGPATQGNA